MISPVRQSGQRKSIRIQLPRTLIDVQDHLTGSLNLLADIQDLQDGGRDLLDDGQDLPDDGQDLPGDDQNLPDVGQDNGPNLPDDGQDLLEEGASVLGTDLHPPLLEVLDHQRFVITIKSTGTTELSTITLAL